MGREVRRVPPGWEHPKDASGCCVPLLGRSFAEDSAQWDEAKRKWDGDPKDVAVFEDYEGQRPVASEYMPDWPAEERTHWQMYETCSEGTPISPVMETPEDLARWLADNKADAGAGRTASYAQWLATIRGGSAPSFFVGEQGLVSGVEFVGGVDPQGAAP